MAFHQGFPGMQFQDVKWNRVFIAAHLNSTSAYKCLTYGNHELQ